MSNFSLFTNKKKTEIHDIAKERKKYFRKNYKNLSMKEKYELYDINKIGYLDIETSGLTGDFDIMLSYAISVRNTQTEKSELRYGVINSNDVKMARKKRDADLIDKRLTEKLLHDIKDLDCLIGHWFIGKKRHDIPFVRTRCLINGIDGLPKHKQIRYGDTQKWGSLLFRTHNFGLATLGTAFNVSTQKTPIHPKDWKLACLGDKKALEYILDHNIKDVIITHKVHKKLEEFVPVPSIYA